MTRVQHIAVSLQFRFNSYLDGLVHPRIRLAGKSRDIYKLWVYTGVVIGTVVIFVLSYLNNISLPLMSALVLIVALLSFALFKSTKVIGRSYPLLNWARRGVYHFQIVALIFTIIFLKIMKQPLLPYLDILVVALFLYQAFGRIGCLMAGCCHGRPHDWGVCYGNKYDHTGYIYFIERVRLFPIQLIESVWLFFLAILAIMISLNPYLPGENFTLYIIGYGAGRFFFEFLRADLERFYIGGFSEPQLTAVLLTSIVVGLELMHMLIFRWWHTGILFSMAAIMTGMSLLKIKQKITKQQILHPDHILEVFRTVDWATKQAEILNSLLPYHTGTENIPAGLTSLGIQISLSLSDAPGNKYQYRLSLKDGILKQKTAKTLSKLIMRLKHASANYLLTEKQQGLFQLEISR